MDGDLDKIRVVGRYFVEVWKAAGMNLQNVQFLWASEEINKRADEYWSIVIDIARKVNVNAKEYCDKIGKVDKPVVVSHHMLSGLKKGQTKMSKSDPDSAIFMEDSRKDVIRKIKSAYCEEGISLDNPILDYCKSIILPAHDQITIEKHGGEARIYRDY